MYAFILSTYKNNLTNLKGILEKAIIWQVEKKISDKVMLDARLTLDQFSLIQQIRSATNLAKNSGEAMTAVVAPVFEDKEETLQDAIKRIDAVLTYLSTLNEGMAKDDLETRIVSLPWAPGKGLVAEYYLTVYAINNFFFHYTTAYAILRHYGLSIGKMDYMGAIDMKDLA